MTAEFIHKPDTPFRSGTSGKYKLLIKSVTQKSYNYEYELVDAEGKEYNAVSELHYAENQLLRCIVSFSVVNARLSVSDTVICKKQDLATLSPEEKKTKKESKPISTVPADPQRVTKSKTKASSDHLGDPRSKRVSGIYILRVAIVENDKAPYTYLMEDAKGNLYKAKSETLYPIGRKVTCRVSVSLSPGGELKICITSMGRSVVEQISKKRKIHKKYHFNPSYSHSDWPSPANGDHFRLIYTPMGNKR